MDRQHALSSLAALSHALRLDVFRLLVGAGTPGMSAGEIAANLGVRLNTLSTNLAVLDDAGLIRRVREGRHVRCIADMDGMRALLGFLMADCCGGRPESCRLLLEEITVAIA